MGRERMPHVGRPFNAAVTEHQMNDAFQTMANVKSMTVSWPMMVENTAHGGIRIWIDPSAFTTPSQAAELIWPVVVRDVRDDADHFITVQDVDLTDTDPWDGLMRPIGEAYQISIWGHGAARDFRMFLTRQTELTRETPILDAFLALGQPWVKQYIRWDGIAPRGRLPKSDCIPQFTRGG